MRSELPRTSAMILDIILTAIVMASAQLTYFLTSQVAFMGQALQQASIRRKSFILSRIIM